MELWDAYDGDLNKVDGVVLVRGEEIPDGLFHLVAEVMVKHAGGDYLLSSSARRTAIRTAS